VGKKEDLIKQLEPILHDPFRLKKFLEENSNLPGPRSNLELAFAFAEVYEDEEVVKSWVKITEDQAGVNDPASFPVFCAAICLGKIYMNNKDKELIRILKELANDNRWRMREAVAFGFQIIGENDFNELESIITDWIDQSNNFEKRTILVSLAHPKFLNPERANLCFKITDLVLQKMDTEKNFEVLKKGLEFTISVFVAANPESGFNFIDKWTGKDNLIDKILKQNLKKNRLVIKYAQEVKILMDKIK
jgi:hypothetical protein